MASKSSKTRKIHLSRPTNERRTMCGRTSGVEETNQPRKVTCKTCCNMYEINKQWYAAAKRRQTIAGNLTKIVLHDAPFKGG